MIPNKTFSCQRKWFQRNHHHSFNNSNKFSKWLFPITGLVCLIWFLERVIPKQSWAQYTIALILFLSGLTVAVLMMSNSSTASYSSSAYNNLLTGSVDSANHPMGMAKVIFPGKVVRVHNPDVTNENCVVDDPEYGYFMSENMNQTVVDKVHFGVIQAR